MKAVTLTLILVISIISFHVNTAETQIFYEDFETGVENWDLQPGWSVILEDGNHILQGTQHTFAVLYVEGVVNSIEVRLKLLKGTLHLNIRSKLTSKGLNRYLIGFNKDSSYIQKQLDDNFQHLSDGKGISLNQWHTIQVEIVQEEIAVFSDNNLLLSIQDKNLIKEGTISFETLEDSHVYIDDVRAETTVFEARQIPAGDLFPSGSHEGDITLNGRDFLILENGEFEQFGNIYLRDSSRLIIRNATFKITRYQRMLNHWGIHLEGTSSLEVDNSKLVPGEGTLFVVEADGRAQITMKDSPTEIHLFTVSGGAKAVVENSEIVGEIGGAVSPCCNACIRIKNSKIGSVSLGIPNGARFEAEGLGTGFFERWDLHENAKTSEIDYNLTLENTELVTDDLGPGPFERGWVIFTDSGARVRIKESELRKVIIELHDEKAEFSHLLLETTTNFSYKSIDLENVTVTGQWGIFLNGSSEVTVKDSDGFWTFIYDSSKLTLINTHMNEFDPRNFSGEIVFENCRWDMAAEIIENNNFVLKGSLTIGEIGGFSWEDSTVTRIFDVIGKENAEIALKKGGEPVWQGKTDGQGEASFSIKFDDTNFYDSWELEDSSGAKVGVDFFSATPITLDQGAQVDQDVQVTQEIQDDQGIQVGYIFLVGVLIAMVVFFFWKKSKKK